MGPLVENRTIMTDRPDLKKLARQLAAKESISYTAALNRLRAQAKASQDVPLQITTVSIEVPPYAAVFAVTPMVYLCHHCAQTGEIDQRAGREESDRLGGLYGFPDLDEHDRAIYLVPHCPGCTPPSPPMNGFKSTPEVDAWARVCGERRQALRRARDAGDYPGTYPTDYYRCSAGGGSQCWGGWETDKRTRLPFAPLYDRGTDLFAHPCPGCWIEHGQERCGELHQEFAKQIRSW